MITPTIMKGSGLIPGNDPGSPAAFIGELVDTDDPFTVGSLDDFKDPITGDGRKDDL
jgi:hypothetical protein